MEQITSLRWDSKLAETTKMVAKLNDVSVNAFIREAVEIHIARCQDDPEFQDRLKRRIQSDQRLLDELSD